MEDEVRKHTRKIFRAAKNKKSSIGVKLAEIIVEVFIIVLSVTLSIGLHNWSLRRHQQKEATEFLTDLKDDLNLDIKSMSEKNDQMSKAIKEYSFLRDLIEERLDSLSAAKAEIGIGVYYVIRKTNDGNYEGFKSSGKIGYIENKKLKKLILAYYQESMPSIGETEKYYNSRLGKIEELIYQDKEKKAKLLDPVLKTALEFVIQNAINNKNNYDSIIKQAEELITEIEKEINE